MLLTGTDDGGPSSTGLMARWNSNSGAPVPKPVYFCYIMLEVRDREKAGREFGGNFGGEKTHAYTKSLFILYGELPVKRHGVLLSFKCPEAN